MASEMKNISKASTAKLSKGQNSINGRNCSKAITNPVGTKTDSHFANKKSPLTTSQISTESKRSSIQKTTTSKTSETSTSPTETEKKTSLITKSKAKQIQPVSINKEAKIISLQKSAKKKTTPRSTSPPSVRKSSWTPRSTAKRITTLTVIIVCFIVAILLIAFIYALADVKPEIEHSNIIQSPMTYKCQEKYGACWYFPKKFVDSCQSEKCYSLEIQMEVVQKAELLNGKVESELNFYPPTNIQPKGIKVPESVACDVDGVLGLCRNGKCVEPDENDEAFEKYLRLKPVDGGWRVMDTNHKLIRENENGTGKLDCIILPQINDVFSALKLTMNHKCQHPSPCYRYKFDFLSCTNPYPAYGGKPCWNNDAQLEWHEWPLQISKAECKYCPPKESPQLNCLNQTNVAKQCIFVRNVIGELPKLFEPCCLKPLKEWPPEVPFGTNGRCVIGSCVAVDPTD